VSELKFKPEQRLQGGDVLLQARGVNYPAALVDDELGKAVAAPPLCVVRSNSDELDPAYLVAFLSNPVTQAHLRSRASGTSAQRPVRSRLRTPPPSFFK
jgi:hypothetical protein